MLLRVLKAIEGNPGSDADGLAKSSSIDRGTIISSINALESDKYVHFRTEAEYSVEPSKEGLSYKDGFPEEELVEKVKSHGGEIAISSIKDQIGLIWAKKNGWIEISEGKARLKKEAHTGEYAQRKVFNALISGSGKAHLTNTIRSNPDVVKLLESRKLLTINRAERIEDISLTDAGKEAISKWSGGSGEIAELTRDIITKRAWTDKKFRKYDINAVVDGIYPARAHPVMEFIDIVRNTWMRMGFTEVEGPIVESAFWNFDALFVPQDHPTRDMQDTFFLSNPESIEIEDRELMGRISAMHRKGWQMQWKEKLATQAVLKTQSTAATIRHVRKIASALKEGETARFFSVGKTFRNESIDYKHLAEFYQVDGMVIGDGVNLANLIHVISEFYARLGFVMGKDIHIRPSYFPFVEPGMEVYYTPEDGSKIELLGSGVIRKEISKAMGTNKRILAWGGGIDRLLLKGLKIESITELYRNSMEWLRNRNEIEL